MHFSSFIKPSNPSQKQQHMISSSKESSRWSLGLRFVSSIRSFLSQIGLKGENQSYTKLNNVVSDEYQNSVNQSVTNAKNVVVVEDVAKKFEENSALGANVVSTTKGKSPIEDQDK